MCGRIKKSAKKRKKKGKMEKKGNGIEKGKKRAAPAPTVLSTQSARYISALDERCSRWGKIEGNMKNT